MVTQGKGFNKNYAGINASLPMIGWKTIQDFNLRFKIFGMDALFDILR